MGPHGWFAVGCLFAFSELTFAQGYQPPSPAQTTSHVDGWMQWDATVRDDPSVGQTERKGSCHWEYVFATDGTEYVGNLGYENQDIAYLGAPNDPYARKRIIKTTGPIVDAKGRPVGNGRLRYSREGPNWRFSYTVPSYEAYQVVEYWTRDPYRGNWSLQSTGDQYRVTVLCGPGQIGPAQPIGSIGPQQVDATQFTSLNQQVPRATLLNRWSFNLPGTRPSQPRIGQGPGGVPANCAAVFQQEQQLSRQMVYQPTWESQQAIKRQLDQVEVQAMACRRIANGLPPINSDGSPMPACTVTRTC